ncbi:hypothetical protein D3C71_1307570 [compost metagenome]
MGKIAAASASRPPMHLLIRRGQPDDICSEIREISFLQLFCQTLDIAAVKSADVAALSINGRPAV